MRSEPTRLPQGPVLACLRGSRAVHQTMELVALGVNYQTAPLSIREQIAFGLDNLQPALQELVGQHPVREAAIVSTCNRTEIYCATSSPTEVASWLALYHQVTPERLLPYLYELPRERAVSHAFRVASGLDSMVLGEPQILGQMKQAAKTAERAGTLGTVLHKLFQRTFSVAKEVRSRTDIGTSSVSMAAAAVRIAERIYPSIAEQSVLFVGAGEMIELCAAHFVARSPRHVVFANRTLERGREIAHRFSGEPIALEEVPSVIANHDIIITSTGSPLPLIGKGLIERAIKVRRHRPMLIVDLAVPRDVEPEVSRLNDVFLYTVDDLGRIVKEGMDMRGAAVSAAESIISEGVSDFMRWLSSREAVPAIRALREQAEGVRKIEVERAMRALARGEPPETVLEALSHGLTNKFLHGPTHALHGTQGEDRERLVSMLSRFYLSQRRSR
ncbi:MAG: glutamyl-tRNA reductase [Betaproteobacteria bacterium]|nr:glutamyl-tRNA reductase [Betaproteobacteria bacterium]